MTDEWQHPVDFHMKRCRERLKNGDTEGALADIEEAITQNRDIGEYLTAGIIAREAGKYDEAIHIYTELITRYPSVTAGYFGRHTAYYFKKHYDKAIENQTAIIQLEPWYAPHYHQRAKTYSEKQDFASALTDYTEAIRLSLGCEAQYHFDRGLLYRHTGDIENAIADFKKVIECNTAWSSIAEMAKINLASLKSETPDLPDR